MGNTSNSCNLQTTMLVDCSQDSNDTPCIGGYVFVGLTTLAYAVTTIMVVHSAYNYLYKAKKKLLTPFIFYGASLIICILRLVELCLMFVFTDPNKELSCGWQVKF